MKKFIQAVAFSWALSVSMLVSGCISGSVGTDSPGASTSVAVKTAPTPSQGASQRESELAPQTLPEGWIETTGTVTNVTRLPDGKYGFTLTYEITDGTIIPQHYFGKPRKPAHGQVLRVRYDRHEPIVYKLLDEIRYE